MNIFMQMFRIKKITQGFECGRKRGRPFSTKEEEKKLRVSQHAKWMEGTVFLLGFVRWDILCVY